MLPAVKGGRGQLHRVKKYGSAVEGITWGYLERRAEAGSPTSPVVTMCSDSSLRHNPHTRTVMTAHCRSEYAWGVSEYCWAIMVGDTAACGYTQQLLQVLCT